MWSIIAKCASSAWMLIALVITIKSYVSCVNESRVEPISGFFGGIFMWVIIGFIPVAVAKLAWDYIK